MRIDSSTIGMQAQRSYSSTASRTSKFTMTGQGLAANTGSLFGNLSGTDIGQNEQSAQQAKDGNKETSKDYLSEKFEELRTKLNGFSSSGITNISDARQLQAEIKSIKEQCINYVMMWLFPSRMNRFTSAGNDVSNTLANLQNSGNFNVSANQISMTTFTYQNQVYYEETEYSSYQTTGKVVCADGREIDFNLNLNMSRSFQAYYEESYSIQQFNLCDPLVINLNGNIAELEDQTFFFDIDADGELDEISMLSANSGYLALDHNGDGIINDGSELFGTSSGNGFADLAKYDSDGNGWIDEGDEIWNKLKIWSMDKDGNSQLYSLSEAGLGAICLSSAQTDFSLTDSSNNTKGMIRQTGVFLYETGGVGTVQHVDVTKYNQVS